MPTLGTLIHSFFIDYLKVAKGLRPTSISSYRDGLRLFLLFVSQDAGRKITKLRLNDLTAQRVLRFLHSLEEKRGNRVSTRNHRLVILRVFLMYLGERVPEVLAEAEKVTRIPTKRAAPPPTYYLERNEIETLFAALPSSNWRAVRDTSLLLFLYNTGARVQEVADLRLSHIDLDMQPRVRLHGKGDKWRVCPLWPRTAEFLRHLTENAPHPLKPDMPVFASHKGRPLTRSGIYKIVRRHTDSLDCKRPDGGSQRHISPHVIRHTTAVHLLEAGVEINVIRGWLGHVKLETTYRYAEINRRTKEAALALCQSPSVSDLPPKPPWRNERSLLNWLDSL